MLVKEGCPLRSLSGDAEVLHRWWSEWFYSQEKDSLQSIRDEDHVHLSGAFLGENSDLRLLLYPMVKNSNSEHKDGCLVNTSLQWSTSCSEHACCDTLNLETVYGNLVCESGTFRQYAIPSVSQPSYLHIYQNVLRQTNKIILQEKFPRHSEQHKN